MSKPEKNQTFLYFPHTSARFDIYSGIQSFPLNVTCSACCSVVVLACKQAVKLCVLCFWSIGSAAGVHLSASSAAPAVAIETKHSVCFGVRQTSSLDPSLTLLCSLLFGGLYGFVAPPVKVGRFLCDGYHVRKSALLSGTSAAVRKTMTIFCCY